MDKAIDDAVELMKKFNGGDITAVELLDSLEDTLGKNGMDMLALWGVMIANQAAEKIGG